MASDDLRDFGCYSGPEMEVGLNGDELKKILCRLHPGMSLTVPDAWIDRAFPGPRAKQVSSLSDIALDYGCIWRQGDGVQTFEKREIPATG